MKFKRYGILAFVTVLALLLPSVAACARRKRTNKNEYEQITLPVISIETANHEEIIDRTTYVPITLSVTGCENEQLNITSVTGKIRGRGNSTWEFCEKKSYKLKLDLEVNLLGAGDGGDKEWALLSNAREKSMLRNYAAFSLAKKMNMRAVPDCAYATVVLNGEYIGVYLLCETVKFSKNRLNIDDSGTDKDIGYLVELDKRARSNAESSLEYFFVNDWEVPFSIKSSVKNKAQNRFIKEYFEKTDKAILGGDREEIEEYVDLSSVVDMYILEEFTKDRDVGFSSLYFYKEAGGKLVFGYPWDFDLSLGNDSGEDRAMEINSPKIDYKGAEDLMAAALNRWFGALMGYDWFVELVTARFFELEGAFNALYKEVEQLGYSLNDEAERNYARWKVMGKKQLFEPMKVVLINTYEGQVEYLVTWMKERHDWLEEYFKNYPQSAETSP